MSITGALNSALSGLSAASLRAEVVSANVANANTESYSRRDVVLSAGLAGGRLPGVSVVGVTRQQDPGLTGQRREAEAGLANAQTQASFFSKLEAQIGLPGSANSLNDGIKLFGKSLIEAASRPDSVARLSTVFASAEAVAAKLNDLSDYIQDARLTADQEIAAGVNQINVSMAQVADLNEKIIQLGATSRDAAGLFDERARLIDGIAELLPVREIARPNGAVALYTIGGSALLDGKAAEIVFAPVRELTVFMTQSGGGLSGIEINGAQVTTNSATGAISGGKLAALFDVRDELGPGAQREIDAFARNLIERFEDASIDGTRAPSSPGFFTDAGGVLDPSDEVGLAERITVNPLIDPENGGDLWRIRDGLGAVAPGDVGDARLLNAMSDALTTSSAANSGSFTSARSSEGLASDILSSVSTASFQAESSVGYRTATRDTLMTAELQNGVDTDRELSDLLIIEQAYAANARVIATLDSLIQQLLRI